MLIMFYVIQSLSAAKRIAICLPRFESFPLEARWRAPMLSDEVLKVPSASSPTHQVSHSDRRLAWHTYSYQVAVISD